MIFDHYVHPEFGYLRPTPRLGREIRVALFAALFGASVGAAAIIALSGEDRHGNPAYAARRETEPRWEPKGHYGRVDPPAFRSADIPSSHEAESGPRRHDPLTARSANTEELAKTEKLHRAMPSTADNGPDIARIPLGRPVPFETATPLGGPTNRWSEPSEVLSPSAVGHAPAGTSDPLNTEDAALGRPHSDPLSHTKPHKIARVQSSRQKQVSERGAGVVSGLDSGFGSFGRAYARDISYPRTGFWDWSR